jgi:hypothetical protein
MTRHAWWPFYAACRHFFFSPRRLHYWPHTDARLRFRYHAATKAILRFMVISRHFFATAILATSDTCRHWYFTFHWYFFATLRHYLLLPTFVAIHIAGIIAEIAIIAYYCLERYAIDAHYYWLPWLPILLLMIYLRVSPFSLLSFDYWYGCLRHYAITPFSIALLRRHYCAMPLLSYWCSAIDAIIISLLMPFRCWFSPLFSLMPFRHYFISLFSLRRWCHFIDYFRWYFIAIAAASFLSLIFRRLLLSLHYCCRCCRWLLFSLSLFHFHYWCHFRHCCPPFHYCHISFLIIAIAIIDYWYWCHYAASPFSPRHADYFAAISRCWLLLLLPCHYAFAMLLIHVISFITSPPWQRH